MIDFYCAPTPNAWKVGVMLEECALPYRAIPIDLQANEQKAPAFLAVNPNGRVPAIVDHDAPDGPLPIFESGAILIHLAEKTGRFLAPSGRARVEALEWLMWQMAGLGPMAGQTHHFARLAPPGNDYARDRFVAETARLYGVLDRRLAARDWLAGDGYGVADMACWPWVWFHRMHLQSFEDFPNVARWFFAVAARPAVGRARLIGLDGQDDATRAMMDGPYFEAAAGA